MSQFTHMHFTVGVSDIPNPYRETSQLTCILVSHVGISAAMLPCK